MSRINPFESKSLDDFSITDCHLYIRNYPYGEHVHEVRRHLSMLETSYGALMTNLIETVQKRRSKKSVRTKSKDDNARIKRTPVKKSKNAGKTAVSSTPVTAADKMRTESEGIDKEAVVGAIVDFVVETVIVAVIGTVVILIFNQFFTDGWWEKLRYAVYPAIWMLYSWRK